MEVEQVGWFRVVAYMTATFLHSACVGHLWKSTEGWMSTGVTVEGVKVPRRAGRRTVRG